MLVPPALALLAPALLAAAPPRSYLSPMPPQFPPQSKPARVKFAYSTPGAYCAASADDPPRGCGGARSGAHFTS